MATRRQFLRAAGGAITLAVGGLEIACSVEESSRIEAADLSDDHILTLVRILQHILPHHGLDVQVYRDAVTSIADQVNADPGKRQLIAEGLAALNVPSIWLERSHDDQQAALKDIEDGNFFGTLQTTALEQLYRDERTWALVGYEGEASEFGGYTNRGLNDIDWLPEPEKSGE